jgi:hypothetical protein
MPDRELRALIRAHRQVDPDSDSAAGRHGIRQISRAFVPPPAWRTATQKEMR